MNLSKLKREMKRSKYLFYIMGALVCYMIWLKASYMVTKEKSDIQEKILTDMLVTKDIQKKSENDYKAEYLDRCLRARQVYQYHCWVRKETKLGRARIYRKYAMDLKDYNDLIELSWKLNRELNIPYDSPANYYMLSKWILESAIHPTIEHKTGEVISLTGYTMDGLMAALYHYKYTLKIGRNSPLYIPELYDRDPNFNEIFSDIRNVVKFDYAYIKHLLNEYNNRWDFVLTAFHFGEGKTEYWRSLGLKSVPDFRLDGKWKNHWLRAYYQSVFEIAYGLYQGRLDRVSNWKEIVSGFSIANKIRNSYIGTLKLQFKQQEKFEELMERYKDLEDRFASYKESNELLVKQMLELNDQNLAYDKEQDKSKKAKIKKYIKKLYASVSSLFDKLKDL